MMMQEIKTQKGAAKNMLKMALGLLVVLVGVALTLFFKEALKVLVEGALGPFLILVGLIIVAVSKE